MSNPVIVIGGGGHASVLIDACLLLGREVVGVVDPKLTTDDIGPLGVPVLGDDDYILNFSPSEIDLVNGIGSLLGDNVRRKVYQNFTSKGYVFATVVHPSAVISAHVQLNNGVQIMAGVVVQINTEIGANTLINTGATIDHDCVVGSHCHIAPGVQLCGGVSIGTGTHIGSGATVIELITVGVGALVGAGSVVVKDVQDSSVFYPARGLEKKKL